MKYFIQIILFCFAVAVICVLQYRYWLGENGQADYVKLEAEITKNQLLLDNQKATNSRLKADIKDLKNGLEAVEEHARLDLGLIKAGETFVQMSTATKIGTKKESPKKRVKKTVEAIPEPLLNNDPLLKN